MKITCFTCLFLLNFIGQIPVVTLNFAALAFETPFNRDSVEGCVKEVLNALARSVGARRNVEFTFTGIGRLQIRDSKVKMKFYKEFVNSMDGSGKIVETMVNVSECFCAFLRLIPGGFLSACPHRQFHTLPGILDTQAALSNSYPNACLCF